MGTKISKFLPPIMEYESLNDHIHGMHTKMSLDQKYEPRPPRKQKREIYDPAIYKQLNKRIENMPPKFLNSDVKDLVKYLTESCTDDLAKVHALFHWITSRSLFVTSQENSRKYSASWYLSNILTGYGNFAHFFYTLCWHADIPCVIIGGVTKNSGYKLGLPSVTADMAAQWNAVYVEGDWHFASVQWACIYANEPNDWKRAVTVSDREFSSSRNCPTDHGSHCNVSSLPKKPKTKHEHFYHANDYYFLTDPDELIWTHFPNKKQWQLLEKPVDSEEFLSHFYVREQFYLLGMSLTEKSYTSCVLLVDKCRMVQIEFALPPKRNATYRFKYTLAHHWSSGLLDKNLLQTGKYEMKDDRLLITLHFTSKGTYKLDIFGSEQKNDDFYLICSYVVKCAYTEEGPTLPRKFFLGYGSGFNPLEKEFKTNNGRIKLPFPIERAATIGHALTYNGKVREDCSLLRMIDEDDDNESDLVTMIIELRLPEPGKYCLRVYEKKHAERIVLCNYYITYEKDTRPSLPAIQDPITKHKKIVVLSHPGSFIQTNLDTLKILFRSEYQLNCSLLSRDVANRTNVKSSVLHDMATKECQFNINIPNCGDYTLKVFAKFSERSASVKDEGQLYEVHSYRIRKLDSDQQYSSRWIGADRPASTCIVGTFETYKSVIKISQTDFKNETLLILQYQNEASCDNLVNVFDEEDESYIQATLPQLGDYLLSLLQKDSKTGLVKNVTRYLLRRKQDIEKVNGDRNNNIQRETLEKCEEGGKELEQEKNQNVELNQSKSALTPKSIHVTETADSVKKEEVRLENNDATPKTTEVVKKPSKYTVNKQKPVFEKQFDETKNTECSNLAPRHDLELDNSKRDTNELLKLPISRSEKSPMKSDIWKQANKSLEVLQDKKDKLHEETTPDEKLSKLLNELDELRSTIGSFDHRAVSEVKSYNNPPKGVTVVMKSVFLILNVPEEELKDWKQIQALMRSIHNPFIRRIVNCSSQCVSLKSMRAAEAHLEMLRTEDMSRVSEMAQVLLIWVTKMIEETKKDKLNLENLK